MEHPAEAAQAPTTTPPLYWWIFGISLAAALTPTLWPNIDLRAAALFGDAAGPLHGLHWWWLQPINDYVPAIFRLLLILAACGWLLSLWKPQPINRRRLLAFFFIAGVLGPGAVVNWGVKDNWQRARPYQVENFGGTQKFTRAAVMTDQCDANCSFVSGHVACGIFLASLGLVQRRRQVAWAVAGSVSGLVIGFARMSDMAHWLSDVLWAFPITLLASWLIWKVLTRLYNRPWRTLG